MRGCVCAWGPWQPSLCSSSSNHTKRTVTLLTLHSMLKAVPSLPRSTTPLLIFKSLMVTISESCHCKQRNNNTHMSAREVVVCHHWCAYKVVGVPVHALALVLHRKPLLLAVHSTQAESGIWLPASGCEKRECVARRTVLVAWAPWQT